MLGFSSKCDNCGMYAQISTLCDIYLISMYPVCILHAINNFMWAMHSGHEAFKQGKDATGGKPVFCNKRRSVFRLKMTIDIPPFRHVRSIVEWDLNVCPPLICIAFLHIHSCKGTTEQACAECMQASGGSKGKCIKLK